MWKKIIISLFVVVVFVFPIQAQYAELANAAVVSKVGTLTAKKVAKEAIQDMTTETMANLAVMQAMEIAHEYEQKEGFKVVCLDGSAKCDKPVQVKSLLTDSDKSAIKEQSGIELDKMINNGTGFSKWQRFLDWFGPVWLVSFGATALTYAMDGEVRNFFNEVGYNALVSLGFIQPAIPLVTPKPTIRDLSTGALVVEKPLQPPGALASINYTNEVIHAQYADVRMDNMGAKVESTVVFSDIALNNKTGISNYQMTLRNAVNSGNILTISASGLTSVVVGVYGENAKVSAKLGGQNVGVPNGSNITIPLDVTKLRSVMTRLPYIKDGFYYTDVMLLTVEGLVYEVTGTSSKIPQTTMNSLSTNVWTPNNTGQVAHRLSVYEDATLLKWTPYTPTFAQFSEHVDMMESSTYMDGTTGNIALLPPSAINLEEEGTGEKVIRVPAPTQENPDGYVFQKPDGTIVPEENVTTGPDTVVTPSPDGVPQYTPVPTPSNPAPTPEDLTPSPTPSTPAQPHPNETPPTSPPGTGDGEPPMEPFPDGEKCMEKFKFPIFSPIKETFSTAFPFSIPWDIGRAINAAFGDMGQEKPEYEIKIDTAGINQTFKISTPELFDKWKPFTDSLLVFTFDVLIMFGIFRFVKGAGS